MKVGVLCIKKEGVHFDTPPDLEEVSGNFELYSNIKEFHFPKLKTVGGSAMMSINNYDDETFPLLESVGGDMTFQTGYVSWNNFYGPDKILYPSLRIVGGVLDIRPRTPDPWSSDPSELNNTLTNLDFLSEVESIGGFRIENH